MRTNKNVPRSNKAERGTPNKRDILNYFLMNTGTSAVSPASIEIMPDIIAPTESVSASLNFSRNKSLASPSIPPV